MDQDPDRKDTPQRRGGIARRESLSPNERRRIARQAAVARWRRIAGEVPEASHQGELEIGDMKLEVYVLEDGRRLFAKRVMGHALGLRSQGGNAFMKTLSGQTLRSEISEELAQKIENHIIFKGMSGDPVHGYEAAVLIEVCEAIIRARDSGSLKSQQKFLAIQAEFILRAAAKLGIIALIDEASGYSDNKRKDEYRKLFQEFIRDEFAQWEHDEYPEKFFDMIYKLYGLKRKNPDTTKHPKFFGKFIRKYIYYPLANSHGAILEHLDEKNPVVYINGGRKYKMYQFLTEKVGLSALRAHLWQTIGIGAVVNDAQSFHKAFYKAFPEAKLTRDDGQLRLEGF